MSAWERYWQLNADDSIMSDSGVSLFKLVKKVVPGITCFDVEYERGEMNDVWADCVLVPRGNKPFLWHGDPLEPWSEECAEEYDTCIEQNLKRTDASTNRLEGELDRGSCKVWVKLFLARKAVDNDGVLEDLLIVRHGDTFEWTDRSAGGSTSPIEDGTGHGNSI